jgi:serine/threonine-protein kinase
MAVVYKAVQESLNRTVAVKALKTSVASQSQFAVRFEREALSLAQLQHENIIHVYDFYKERGAFFIVMEYVEGIDLYDLLDRCGRLPVDVAAVVTMQVARALDYAHYRGIVHRDIKPANIMVSRSGGVKLMDFGIARDQAFGDLTETGTGLGTPSYMSPEQILGDKLDFRSDLFSLGIVLYQMCTGRKPFIEDEHKSVMHKIRLERFPNPRKLNPDVPRELERIMAKCMQKLPRDRYRSTQDLVLALERFLSRRVEMNYHARLVLFLKNQEVITTAEAEQYLHPAVGPGVTMPPPHATGRSTLARASAVQAIIASAVALTVGLIHLSPVSSGPQGLASLSAPLPRPRGYVRIVANPWAHVFVDGAQVDTTPFAAPLELEAGTHHIILRNEFFAEVSRDLDVAEGTTDTAVRLRIDLADQKALPPSAKASPAPRPAPKLVEAPVLQHTVRKNDTLELLAAEYYGKREFAVFFMVSNGMSHPRPLRPGEKLTIPTAWQVRVEEGDSLELLAERYLGDARRAPFLAAFNQVLPSATLPVGQELTIPFHVKHAAQDREALRAIAAAFYGDANKAELLRGYNFRSAKPLRRGESIIVPIVEVRVRPSKMPAPDPEAKQREQKRQEMAIRAKEALPRARLAWLDGDFASVKSWLVDLEADYLEGDVAFSAAFLLGSAYVAYGDEESAVAAFRKALERRPEQPVRPEETSPKIVRAWEAAGGRMAKR